MKRIFCLYLFLIFNLTLCSCNSTSNTKNQDKPITKIEEKTFSPYTGEEIDKKSLLNKPFMVIVENSKDARPQSGIIDADIVFETMAEGGIPRFIALFQKNSSSKIGPVRSARPYFLNIAKEFSLPFAHCGYSEEAKEQIKKENLMSLNEFSFASSFWRDNSRKAPHNLYTSSEKIRELLDKSNYKYTPNANFNFDKSYWDKDTLPSANDIILKLNRYYKTQYLFKNNLYYKYIDDSPFLNKEDNKPIHASNIIIQVTDIKLQKDNLHIDINLIGKGTGYIISNGKYKKITWSKKDLSSQTEFLDDNNNIVPLCPGKTWWHIIDKSSIININ